MNQERLFEPPVQEALPQEGVVCSVLLDVSGYDAELSYLIDPQAVDQFAIGSIVKVKLRGRLVKGWITSIDLDPPQGVKLAPVEEFYSVGPAPEIVELCRYIAETWAGPFRRVMTSASADRKIRRLSSAKAAVSRLRPGGHFASAFDHPVVTQVFSNAEDSFKTPAIDACAVGQSLILVPMQHQVKPLVSELQRSGVACVAAERRWDAGQAGYTVVGTGKALLSSMSDLRSIVVLDSDSMHYKMQQSPQWDVVSAAKERAARLRIPLVLVSPTPSVLGAHLAEETIKIRPQVSKLAVEIVDMTDTSLGFHTLFSPQLIKAFREAGEGLLVLNRKGRAAMLACGSCRELVRTEDGAELMVEDNGVLQSRTTGESRAKVCLNCGSTNLLRLRLGVGGAAEQLSSLLRTAVVDLDAGSEAERTSKFIVGTQSALYRRILPSVICFADLDNDFMAPGFNSVYRSAAQVVAAKRLLSKSDRPRLIVQSRNPNSEFMEWIRTGHFDALLAKQSQIAEVIGLAPFGCVAKVGGPGASDVAKALKAKDFGIQGPRNGSYLFYGQKGLVEEVRRAVEAVPARTNMVVDPWDL